MNWQWVGFILLGAVIGWVLEWLYDMWLWRRRGGKPPRDGNSDLEIRLASSEAEAKKLRQELEGVRGKAKSGEARTIENRERDPKEAEALKSAQKELEALRGKLNVALGEVSQLKSRTDGNADAAGKLSATQKDMKTLQTRMGELETLSARLRDADSEVLRLRGQLENRAAPEDSAALRSEIFSLQARLKDAEGMRGQFEAKEGEISQLRATVAEMVHPDQHRDALNELEHLRGQLGNEASGPVDSFERIHELEAELERVRDQLSHASNTDALGNGFQGVAPEQHSAVPGELESLKNSLHTSIPFEQHQNTLGELETLRSSFTGMVAPEQHQQIVGELETLRGQVSGTVSADEHQSVLNELEVLRQRSTELVERTQLDDLERHLLEVNAQLEESRMTLRAAQGHLESLEATEDAVKQASEAELGQMRGRMGQLEAQLSHGTVLEHELEELRERMVRMIPADVYSSLEVELAGVRRQLEARGMDVGEQEARLNSLETELETLRPQITELHSLRERASALIEPAQLEDVRAQLEGVHSTLEARQVELEAAHAQVAQVGQQLEALRGQNESLSVQLFEVETLRVRVQELEGAQAQLGVLETETEELRRQLSGMVGQDALHQAQGEIRILKDALDHTTEQATHQSAELEDLQTQLGNREAHSQELSGQLGVAQRDLERLHSLEARMSDLDRELEEGRAQITQLVQVREQLGARETELIRLRGELEEAQQSGIHFSAAEAELSDLRAQLEGRPSQSEIEALRGELETLLAQLENRVSGDDHTQLQTHYASLQDNHTQLQNNFGQLQAELEGVRGQLSAAGSQMPSSDLEHQNAELETLRAQMSSLNTQVAPLRARAEQAQNLYTQLKAAQAELEGLRTRGIQVTGAASVQLSAELDDLQRKLNESEDERSIMRSRLSEMVDKETVLELEDELEQLRAQAKNTSGQTAQLLSYIEKMQSAETEIRILKNRLEGKPDEKPVKVDTGALGSAMDDMFGGFMSDSGDKK